MFYQRLEFFIWTGLMSMAIYSVSSLQSGSTNCTEHLCTNELWPIDVRYMDSFTPCHLCVMCNCDDKCMEYDDCCSNTGNKSSSKNRSPDFSYECVGIRTKDALWEQHYYMLSKCPHGSDIEIRNKCLLPEERNVQSWLPVKARRNGDSWVTYRNQYCGFCNGVLPSEIRPWEIYVKCEQPWYFPVCVPKFRSFEDVVLFVDKHDSCVFENEPLPDIPERRCETVPHYVAECNVTGEWDSYNGTIEGLCQKDFMLLAIYGTYYKNKYCYICNTYSSDKLPQEIFECDKDTMIFLLPPFENLFGEQPLSMQINFNPFGNRETGSNTTGTNVMACNYSGGEMFDVYTETCHELYCPSSLQNPEDRCAPTFGNSKGLPLYARILLEPEQTISLNITEINSTVIQLMEKLQRKLSDYPEVQVFFMGHEFRFDGHEAHCITTLQEVTLEIYLVSKERTEFASFSRTFITFIETLWLLELEGMSYTLKGRLSNNLKNEHFISIGDSGTQVSNEINAVFLCSINPPVTVYADTSRSQTNNILTYMIFTVMENVNPVPCFDSFHPITYLYNCSTAILNSSEYNTNGTAGTIVLLRSQIILQNGNYLRYTNGDIEVCADPDPITDNCTANHSGKTDDNININSSLYIQKIVTFVSLSTSILCLMFTLLTHCLLKSLRTLPGQNSMCLSATIIIAQGLYLSLSMNMHDDVMCKALGILLHYWWLASFFWMNVCSFHVFVVFKNSLKSRSKKGFERPLLYFAYANFTPFLIVAATVVFSYFLSSGNSIGYGGDNCYLSSKIAVAVSFALPLGLIIVTNIVLFIIIMVAMKGSPMLQKTQEQKSSSLVYVTLSALTGLTWIFGFIARWTLLDGLWYIFTILCGAQGIFISLSFIANRRVFDKYKQLYRRCGTGKKKENHTYTCASKTGDRRRSADNISTLSIKFVLSSPKEDTVIRHGSRPLSQDIQ